MGGVGAVVVDARVSARGGCAGVSGVGMVEALAVDVCEGEGQGAGHHGGGGGGDIGFCGAGHDGAEVGHDGVFDEAEGSVFVCVVGGRFRRGGGKRAVGGGCVSAFGGVEGELLFPTGLGCGGPVAHFDVRAIACVLWGGVIGSSLARFWR